MKGRVPTAFVMVVSVVLTACGTSSTGGGGTAPPAIKVALVLPGPINDKGFNQTGYMGLLKCKEGGAQTSYAENVPVSQFVKTFQNFAQKNDVVIGHGFEFGDIAAQVASQYPKVKFVVTSNPLKPKDSNVVHVVTNSTQGAYLAGALAGMVTKTNKLGGIAGFDFPVLKAQMAAFEAGAKSVNPQITFKTVYLGTFDDVAKGKEAAASFAASGVDVVYHIADAAGIGVINGAHEAGIKAIGWGLDQNSVSPDTVIASQIIDQTSEIGRICASIKDGKFEGGTVHVDGLRSGLVKLSKTYNVPADIQPKLDAIKAKIEDGTVTVPVPSIGGDVPGSGPASG